MDLFLVELVGVFVIAVLVGIVFRYFGLPSIIGHVLAGFILGLSGFISLPSVNVLSGLGTLGVTLLLFLVGLEMNWHEIKKVGKEAFYIFLGQTLLLFLVFVVFGFFAVGFSIATAMMFGIAMTFSSTIVVVKVLSEKHDLNSYTSRLSLGVLLLQDILAIILLVFLPSIKTGFNYFDFGMLIVKLLGLTFFVNVMGHYFISKLMKHVVKTAEDLVLFSLAWFAAVVYISTNYLHLSPEIAGLLAGISLSSSWGHFQIVSKIRVLRDVFLTMFFVLLGFQVGVGGVNWLLVLILVTLVLLVKFIVTHLVARVFGLSGRASILLGLNMTQVSEFSMVVMASGLSLGIWSGDIVKAVTLAGLITMTLSTILISISEKLSIRIAKISKLLFLFSGKNKQTRVEFKNHIVLFGGDRTGKSIMSFLKRLDEKVVVVDYNPQIISEIKAKGGSVIFADATDPDVIDLTNINEAKLIILTMKNVDDSLSFISQLKNLKIEVPVIADADGIVQAKKLYKAGVDYVILSHFVSGWHMGQVIKKYGKDKETLSRYRRKQEVSLKETYEGEY